jgi:hypothetical protein
MRRGWMIAGGSVEILKNRIAGGDLDRRFDQRGKAGRCGGVMGAVLAE